MKIFNLISKFFLHLTTILAISFLIFAILDWYNPLMAFTTNTLSSKLLILFCISTIFSSITYWIKI